MGREVRMVPADWQHPKDERGHFIPLHKNNGAFAAKCVYWDAHKTKWDEGFTEDHTPDRFDDPDFRAFMKANPDTWVYDLTRTKWRPKSEAAKATQNFDDWDGPRPVAEDYMPDFAPGTATHLMMYETCSEGTPISPAFATPEELARWLADNGASAFGRMTATYEEWLATVKAGWSIGMVYTPETWLRSGVEAMADSAQGE